MRFLVIGNNRKYRKTQRLPLWRWISEPNLPLFLMKDGAVIINGSELQSKRRSRCRLRGAAPISIEHPGRLSDLSATIAAAKESIIK